MHLSVSFRMTIFFSRHSVSQSKCLSQLVLLKWSTCLDFFDLSAKWEVYLPRSKCFPATKTVWSQVCWRARFVYSAVLSLDCRAQQMGAHLKPLMETLRLELAVKATVLYLRLFQVQFLLNFSTLGRGTWKCVPCFFLFFLFVSLCGYIRPHF